MLWHLFFITGALDTDDLRRVKNMTWDARSRWYDVGLELGMLADTLDAIRMDHRDYCGPCYTNMLKVWFRNDPNPTWSSLAEALRSPAVGLDDLAEKLPTQ